MMAKVCFLLGCPVLLSVLLLVGMRMDQGSWRVKGATRKDMAKLFGVSFLVWFSVGLGLIFKDQLLGWVGTLSFWGAWWLVARWLRSRKARAGRG